MNIKTLKLIEDFTSANGVWRSLELIVDKIYLEFDNVEIYKENSEYGECIIRLSGNPFFNIYYDKKEDIPFLNNFKEDMYSFYEEFSFKLKNNEFKFQDNDYVNYLENKYSNSCSLIENTNDCDFVLAFNLDNFAIIVGGNNIHFFNDFEILNEDMIKNLSNKWCVNYLNNL